MFSEVVFLRVVKRLYRMVTVYRIESFSRRIKKNGIDWLWAVFIVKWMMCKRIGINFSFVFADSQSSWYTGMLYGYGHVMTFDGAMYEFNSPGEFQLTKLALPTGTLSVTVHRVG